MWHSSRGALFYSHFPSVSGKFPLPGLPMIGIREFCDQLTSCWVLGDAALLRQQTAAGPLCAN